MDKKILERYKDAINVTERSAKLYHNTLHKGQFTEQESLTQEGLAEDISKILQRFDRGQPVLGTNNMYFETDENTFDTATAIKSGDFDLSDLQNVEEKKQALERDIKEYKERRKAIAETSDKNDAKPDKSDGKPQTDGKEGIKA